MTAEKNQVKKLQIWPDKRTRTQERGRTPLHLVWTSDYHFSFLPFSLRSNIWNNLHRCTVDPLFLPPPLPQTLLFHPLVHIWGGRWKDYGPSHVWHGSRCLRYIIILVENDVMRFKTFVLRTPSVPPQMMSQALSTGREVVKQIVWGIPLFACCCCHPVAGEQYAERRGWGSN